VAGSAALYVLCRAHGCIQEVRMIDMVEARVIAGQIAEHLVGKVIVSADLGERRKKSMRDAFLLRVEPEEFRARLEGATLSDAYARYREICLETDRGGGLALGDVYGRVLAIAPGAAAPGNPPVSLGFQDGWRLVVVCGVWAAMRLATVEELRALRDGSDPNLLDVSSAGFTPQALGALLARPELRGQTVKQVLTRFGPPCLMSLMGAYAQEALYRARLFPKMRVQALAEAQVAALHGAIEGVVREALAAGGRASERDLFDRPGRFAPAVSRETLGQPCPACGTPIAAMNMGGAGQVYYCPGCQARQ
jgi:formamidopyrimidine-DNA glycosylase